MHAETATPIKGIIKYRTAEGKVFHRLVADCEDTEAIKHYLKEAGCTIIRNRTFPNNRVLKLQVSTELYRRGLRHA